MRFMSVLESVFNDAYPEGTEEQFKKVMLGLQNNGLHFAPTTDAAKDMLMEVAAVATGKIEPGDRNELTDEARREFLEAIERSSLPASLDQIIHANANQAATVVAAYASFLKEAGAIIDDPRAYHLVWAAFGFYVILEFARKAPGDKVALYATITNGLTSAFDDFRAQAQHDSARLN